MSKRIVICAGGRLGPWALRHIGPDDFVIAADSGALFLIRNGISPDIAIGDFDSVTPDEFAVVRERSRQIVACDPVDKNYTDTEMAFRLALDKKPDRIVLLGALGTRFDHSLANVHLLALAEAQGIDAAIIDEHNLLALGTATMRIRRQDYSQVSLLPLSESVTGITLTGFQYPLINATLTIGQSLGISNVLLAEEGVIDLTGGKLLVIQSRD